MIFLLFHLLFHLLFSSLFFASLFSSLLFSSLLFSLFSFLTKHRAGQHTLTETGDTQELNSEGNEKRRRQRESRVNSGGDKKVR